MKHLLFKKSALCLIMFLFLSITTFSQNTYLSFEDGIKDAKTEIETEPTRSYESVKSNDVEIGYVFTGAFISEKLVEKSTYNYFFIDGFGTMSQIGAPALPAHSDIIAMPKGAKGKIIILDAKYYEYDGYMIHPALEPARDTEGAPSPKFKKDEAVYSRDEFFPKNIVEIVSVGVNRGTCLATTQIRPVQFNPVTGKVRVYTSIKYRLETVGGEESFDYIAAENTLHFTNLLKRSVINSESIPDGFSAENQKKNKSGGEKNYIIITHSQYLSQAEKLANWKRQLGYSVEVVSKSSWTSDEVKTEVQNRYNSWIPKPDYFVIIGDHTGSYAVPGEIHQDPSYGDDFATDLYVACMDGGTDHFPDMAHGRISVSTDAEATVIIDKIINYEKTPTTNTDYYSNILNCAQYQDVEDDEPADGYAARRFCHTSEEIRDYLQDNFSYNSTRVYNTSTTWDVTDLHYNNGNYSDGQLLPAELRDVSFNWSGSSSDITTAIDAGKFMVFHRDHGYTGGSGWHLPYYTTSSMTSLSNGDLLPVVFSMNCHTGEFQLDNCFAEKFLRMENKGAVGVVGASYYSYSGYNDAMSIGMIDAIWSDPGISPDFGSYGTGVNYTIGAGNDVRTMGDVVNQGLYAMVQNYSDNTYTFELFHYFGDPAMKIWTENPNNNLISATIPSTVDCDATSFTITGCNVDDAIVTLVVNDILVGKATVSGGTATMNFDYAGNSTDPAIVTISKENHKPYVISATVNGTCEFPPSASFMANKNNILPGESVQFTDNSLNEPTSWFWYFEGGTPSTSSDQNPIVSYADLGSYNVGLKVVNANGEDSIGYDNLINVEEASYCAASATTCDEYVSRVELNTIDNSSSCGNYQDFTAISTDLGQQLSYEIVITNGSHYDATDAVGCWIDWNQDMDFDDENEEITIAYSAIEGTNEGEGLGIIEVPADALLGETKLRVRVQWGGTPTSCGTTSYGEVEDYTINVFEPVKHEVTFKVKDGTDNNVEGARVLINSKQQYTDDQGEALYNLVAGSHAYEVSAVDFYLESGSVEVIDENMTYEVTLLSTSIDNDILNSNEFKIYPNPTSGVIKIEGDKLMNSKISVYDISGKQILNRISENSEVNIDISDCSNGIYIIQIDTGEKVYKQKLIKE